MSTSHEQELTQALVELSDTLISGYDVVEFLHVLAGRCVDLIGVQAAGIMIGDQRGALRVMASSSEQARLLELFEVETDEGPCVACYTTRTAVTDPDLGTPDPRWRRFAGRARQAGFRAVHAVPLRLRDDVIGVLNLFATAPGALDPVSARTARALANVTTLSLLQHRAIEYREVLAEEMQHAMNSRVVIEQAKGVLAERLDLGMDDAFTELRRFAGRAGGRLSDVAAAVAGGDHGPATAGPRELRVLLVRRFDLRGLPRLRAAVGAATARHGLAPMEVAQFVLAVHEAAVNAVLHGGGSGQLLLWLRAGVLFAEISDHGPGIPAIPQTRAEPDALGGGRGLWLINRVCGVLDIDTGSTGTRLLLRYPLDRPALPGAEPVTG